MAEAGFFDDRVNYHTGSGKPASPLECVVPIGFADPETALFWPIATGVFISDTGLVCTARHVFEFEARFCESMPHISNNAVLSIYQYYPNHTVNARPIAAVHAHPRFDVAVAVCQPFFDLSTGERFFNMMHALTDEILPIGASVHQYSYPDPILHEAQGETQTVIIPLCTTGTVIDWLPNGMGRVFPSPVYVIEGYIGAGSSGGPVLDRYGRCIAINSRGCADGNYYYAIPVSSIADIEMHSVTLSSPPVIVGPTIREMVARKMIPFMQVIEDHS